MTSDICEGEDGKIVTEKMAATRAKRKQIDLVKPENPNTLASQFKMRQKKN